MSKTRGSNKVNKLNIFGNRIEIGNLTIIITKTNIVKYFEQNIS